jgi:hypothetical protein
MSLTAGAARTARRIFTGLILMLTVSLATAAIVMYLPSSPVMVTPGRGVQPQAMNEYVQLHRARNAVVPDYMAIDVTPAAAPQ